MSAQIIPVPPFDLVVFGGTGDLAMRKLMPALYHRDRYGQLPGEARIIGVSRSALDDAGYRGKVEEALVRHVSKEFHDPAVKHRFLARLAYVQLDITADGGWKRLHEQLDKFLLQEGLLDELEIVASGLADLDALRLRTSAREMIMPHGLAASFQILVQAKHS